MISTWRIMFLIIVILLAGPPCFTFSQPPVSSDAPTAWHRGIYEITLDAIPENKSPYYDITLVITFIRPDGSEVSVEGFFDGGTQFIARAYCDVLGTWQWRSVSNNPGLDGKSGTFAVKPSTFKGKLRIHPEDPYQFAYDNGDWFLHIGDTGYRYVVPSEPFWQEYIDQAAEMGATKIRTWFSMQWGDVSDLFIPNGKDLALFYWKEIERRILYALEHHPQIILQLIPYAEDTKLIRRYGQQDTIAQMVGRYAQARWSSFPNVQWTLTNDRKIVQKDSLEGREVLPETIRRMGNDMAQREPWGTLITNHQSRFDGYDFVHEDWSDIVTLEDLDEVDGKLILEYRQKGQQPVVLDEDRYELYRPPANRRYFFRRLMWGSLLSGGHATYGGLKTYERYQDQEYRGPYGEVILQPTTFGGKDKGLSGYFDANRAGMLYQGGHDFRHIHQFFRDTQLTLVGMEPDDALVGNDPLRWKCAYNANHYLIYLANPSGENPETDEPQRTVPAVDMRLRRGNYTVQWFDPDTGSWYRDKKIQGGGDTRLEAPGMEDWILLLKRED